MATTFPVRAETQPAIKDIDQLIAALRKTGKEAGMTEKEIDDLVKKSRKFGTDGAKGVSEINKGMGGLNNTIKTVGTSLVALFAVDRMRAFVGSVVTITAEFQKLEAVLTNTLGSKSAAQRAFADIQAFATKTPFSVLELTQSFVKLANQGFRPTTEELRKLGDLASSTGKTFDELTEAVIDAQTGEFERLKNFGIRASKEGDKVTFSFKEVATQVDFTASSIREYLLSLGDLEGVTGAANAISQTLGGTINNLGDSWDKFLATLGSSEAAQNVSTRFLKILADLVDKATNLIMTKEQMVQIAIVEGSNKAIEAYKASGKSLEEYIALLEQQYDAQYEAKKVTDLSTTSTVEQRRENLTAVEITKASIVAIKEYQKSLDDAEAIKTKAATNTEFKKAQEDEIKNWQSAAEKGEAYRKKMAEIYKMMNEVSDPALNALSKSVNDDLDKNLARIGGAVPENNLPGAPANPDFDPNGKSDEEIEAEKQYYAQQTFDHTVSLINDLSEIKQDAFKNELSMLHERYNQELTLAGDNEEAKDKIKSEFQKREAAIRNAQAESERRQAFFNILVNQGPAIAKTLASAPFPFNIALGVLAAAQFTTLLAKQSSIQPPKFKEGVYGLPGPGTETSDSIPAWLSRNESVVPADRSKHFKELLKPMIESDHFQWADVKNIVDGKLPELARPIIIQATNTALGSEIDSMKKEVVKAINNKRETRFVFDEKGFGAWIQSGNDTTKVLRKRYSM